MAPVTHRTANKNRTLRREAILSLTLLKAVSLRADTLIPRRDVSRKTYNLRPREKKAFSELCSKFGHREIVRSWLNILAELNPPISVNEITNRIGEVEAWETFLAESYSRISLPRDEMFTDSNLSFIIEDVHENIREKEVGGKEEIRRPAAENDLDRTPARSSTTE